MSETEYNMIARMKATGGAFVRNLAFTYVSADPVNREKLRSAFEGIFSGYEDWVKDDTAPPQSRPMDTRAVRDG